MTEKNKKLEIQQITVADIIHKSNISTLLERINKEFKNIHKFKIIKENKNYILEELNIGKAITLLTYNFGGKKKNSLTLNLVQGIYPIVFVIFEMRFIEKIYLDKEYENGYTEIIIYSKNQREAHYKYEEVDKKIDRIKKQQLSPFKNLFNLLEFHGEGSCVDFYITRDKEIFDEFSKYKTKFIDIMYTYRNYNNYYLRGIYYDKMNNDTLHVFQNYIYKVCYILLYDRLYKYKIEKIIDNCEFKYKEARIKKRSFKYFHSLLSEKFVGNVAEWENVFSNDILDKINELSSILYNLKETSEYHSLLDNLIANFQKHNKNVISKWNRLNEEINAYINHIKIYEDRKSQRASIVLSSFAVLAALAACIVPILKTDWSLIKEIITMLYRIIVLIFGIK